MIFRFLICAFVILTLWAGPAAARETVGLRVGEHADYSRVVFDWKTKVSYTVESKEAGKIILRFDVDAGLQSMPKAAGNMKGVEVLSENPLRIAISIPEGARTRDFTTDSKIVVDIYNAAEDAKKEEAPKQEPPPATAETPPNKPAEPPKEEAKEEKPQEPVAETAPAAQPEETAETKTEEKVEEKSEVKEAELADEEEAQPPPEEELAGASDRQEGKKTTPKKVMPTIVLFSATSNQGMAVFEMNGEVWMVNDVADQIVVPKITGPEKHKLEPLQSAKVPGGRVFKATLPGDSRSYVQGSGLLWRVLVTPARYKRTPTRPERKDVNENMPRSGSLFWALDKAGKVLDVKDPVTGATIKVVTVGSSKQYSGPPLDFVDFRTLPTTAGIAIVPKVDDLEIKITPKGVEVTRPGGLALTSEESLKELIVTNQTRKKDMQAGELDKTRVFDFGNWQLGGIKTLDQNRNIIMAGLGGQNEQDRMQGIMTLAKMYLANAQGSEALGFLSYVEDELPMLAENPQFLAIRGAARAIDWKSEAAFEDLSREELDQYEEIGFWKAYVLADLGDWSQAEDVMPKSFSALFDYSAPVFNRLALVLSEVALRAGEVKQADQLLSKIQASRDNLFDPQRAYLDYLRGESARQRGDVPAAKKLWEPLSKGADDLYRAKAGLALTRLLVDQKELTPEKSIDNLERLRYVWRGDELEGQINYWLGRTYFETGKYAQGLNIMREASILTQDMDFGKRITGEMGEMFAELFLGPKLEEISALDAGALYEQFSDLLPEGPEHDKVVQRLAERLVQGDLLARAGDLLLKQLDNRLQGLQAYDIAVRLAAIYLLDGEIQKATTTLDKALAKLQALPEELQTPERSREVSLLRARALSRNGRPDQALALLNAMEKTPSVNRARADTAWYAGYWDDAAEALEDVVIDQNISLTRPLDAENTGLILQRAVALNLSGDRIALANMREKYSDSMMQTDKSKIFEVITRPRKSAVLADRDTLLGIVSEVDLFKDFLTSYKTVQAPSN